MARNEEMPGIHDREPHESEQVTLDGQTLNIIDCDPAEKKTDIPTVVVPGFTETSQTLLGVMRGLSKEGRRTLSVDNPHGIDTHDIAQHAKPQLRKAVALLKMLDAKGIRKADLVGTSEGAIVIAIAATLQPDRFRNIVLLNPAGLYGDDNIVTLMGRFVLEIAKGTRNDLFGPAHSDDRKELLNVVGKEAQRYIADSKTHSVKEILSVSSTQIDKRLRELQQRHGMKITILAAKNDLLFPINRNRNRVSKMTGIPLDNIVGIEGGHGAHAEDRVRVVRQIDGALDRMEQPQP